MEINDHSANSSIVHGQYEPEPVEVWSIDILEDWEPKPGCCIYRVPVDLRRINEEAYTPQVISIGPFHHNKKELAKMEKQKKRYIHIFSERKGRGKLEEMKRYIKSQEKLISNCYEESSSLSSAEFIDMILCDAVFIIELFSRHFWKIDDFLLEKPCYINTIKRDLQLLENQLPYFVLKELYMLAIEGVDTNNYKGSKDPSFFHISCKFFGCGISMMDGFPMSSLDIKHFTDLLRYSLMEHHPTAKKQEKVGDLPCATKLHESGVRFRCAKEGCMLDLKFDTNKRGILPFFKVYELQIPCFTVNDRTEFFIRNVMALEQCHYPKETHICNYIAFMDFLINTEKDADLLIDKGIIINCLGENAAIANMFNRFCLQTSSSVSCYYDMARDLKQHYESPYNHAKATFVSVYFSNPWKGTATVAATLLLILTIVQTVYSILQFHVQ